MLHGRTAYRPAQFPQTDQLSNPRLQEQHPGAPVCQAGSPAHSDPLFLRSYPHYAYADLNPLPYGATIPVLLLARGRRAFPAPPGRSHSAPQSAAGSTLRIHRGAPRSSGRFQTSALGFYLPWSVPFLYPSQYASTRSTGLSSSPPARNSSRFFIKCRIDSCT
ncbi:hypothetical protein D3C73_1233270 [compost metagenome]